MEKVRFRSPDGSTEKLLRPVHAIKVAAEMGTAYSDHVEPRALFQACDAVRQTYRCRDVRKEIRHVSQLALVNTGPIEIACRDEHVLEQMREAAEAA